MLNPLAVHAKIGGMETANDLFQIYNEAELEDINQLQSEYEEVLTKLNNAESEVISAEVHNALVKEAVAWQEEEKAEIDKKVSALFKKNTEIAQKVKDGFYASWNELEKLDTSYKMNLNEVEELLESKERFTVLEERSIDYETLDLLSKEISELQKVYKEAVDVATLGEVHGVRFPLEKATVITSTFGSRVDPITKSSISYHAGLDLRAAVGTEVKSIFNGVVVDTGFGSLGGYYVTIDHGNGIRSYYCHLSQILCESGQKVTQYETIALSGNSGSRTTGPHLHFALYINGNPVDPGVLYEGR